MRTVYGDHERFIQTYFSTYKVKYFTGDGCRRDEDGYYWITGRVDDVLNVSGHRLQCHTDPARMQRKTIAKRIFCSGSNIISGQHRFAAHRRG
ncbi:AMP-binding protein [Rhizobium leucaenae]|uniref:Acetyl-CoA synthetase n=1 Tax=Rhizobium leucaenae TaxID=29450 RepID=A0A7W7EN31_9HYPH|nr:acetyl-CoA synthetase [Rhizobium leucaenae]MBB6304113.1 acetyl-CoA synthetase [Rhizobium leucaenae]